MPIVAMTAGALAADRERCLEAGMDAFLTEPVRSDELYRVVEEAAGGAGAPDQEAADTGAPEERE